MTNNQTDLFIKSEIECKCNSKHALTAHEFQFCVDQAKRLKELILSHGWDLQYNYHFYMNKLDGSCNAWQTENAPYLILRAEYQDKAKEVKIPILNWR